MAAPVLTFDTLEAFMTQGGGMHIVYLTASRVSDEWLHSSTGCGLNSSALAIIRAHFGSM